MLFSIFCVSLIIVKYHIIETIYLDLLHFNYFSDTHQQKLFVKWHRRRNYLFCVSLQCPTILSDNGIYPVCIYLLNCR